MYPTSRRGKIFKKKWSSKRRSFKKRSSAKRSSKGSYKSSRRAPKKSYRRKSAKTSYPKKRFKSYVNSAALQNKYPTQVHTKLKVQAQSLAATPVLPGSFVFYANTLASPATVSPSTGMVVPDMYHYYRVLYRFYTVMGVKVLFRLTFAPNQAQDLTANLYPIYFGCYPIPTSQAQPQWTGPITWSDIRKVRGCKYKLLNLSPYEVKKQSIGAYFYLPDLEGLPATDFQQKSFDVLSPTQGAYTGVMPTTANLNTAVFPSRTPGVALFFHSPGNSAGGVLPAFTITYDFTYYVRFDGPVGTDLDDAFIDNPGMQKTVKTHKDPENVEIHFKRYEPGKEVSDDEEMEEDDDVDVEDPEVKDVLQKLKDFK